MYVAALGAGEYIGNMGVVSDLALAHRFGTRRACRAAIEKLQRLCPGKHIGAWPTIDRRETV